MSYEIEKAYEDYIAKVTEIAKEKFDTIILPYITENKLLFASSKYTFHITRDTPDSFKSEHGRGLKGFDHDTLPESVKIY